MAATDVLAQPPAPSSATDWLSQAQTATQNQQGMAKAEQTEMAGPMGKAQTQLAGPRPSPPQLQQQPKPPDDEFGKDVSGWLAVGSLLAAIGGAATRQHMTTAFGAFGAFGKGISEGQLKKSEEAFKQWRAASDAATQNNRAMIDEYNTVLADRKLGIDEQMQQIQLIATKYKDPMPAEAAAAGNFTLIAQLQERKIEADRTHQDAVDALAQKHDEFMQSLTDGLDKAGLNTPAGQKRYADWIKTLSPEEAKKARDVLEITHPQLKIAEEKNTATAMDPGTIQTLAQRLVAGDKSASQNLGYGMNPNKKALMDAATKLAKEKWGDKAGEEWAANNAEFMGIQAGERTTGTRAANIGMGVAELTRFIPLASEASAKVDRTKYPSLNAANQAVVKGTGDEAIIRFIDANNAIINAYSQVVTRGGQPTDSARALAQEVLSTAYSKGQYKAGLDQLMKEAQAAKQAPGDVRGELRGAVTGNTPTPTAPSSGGGDAGWKVEPVQ